MANDAWKFSFAGQRGKIVRSGVIHILNSPEVAAAVQKAAERATEGNRRYLSVTRIPGKVAIRGRQPDRVGFKVEMNALGETLHPRHQRNILLQIKRRRVRRLVRAERRKKVRTTKS